MRILTGIATYGRKSKEKCLRSFSSGPRMISLNYLNTYCRIQLRLGISSSEEGRGKGGIFIENEKNYKKDLNILY